MSQCPRCQADNPLGASACQACDTRLMAWGTILAAPEGPSAARPRANIRVVRADGGMEAVFALRKDEVVAGSSAELLLMEDPFVARTQARFYFEGGALRVEDVGGNSGLFVRLRAQILLDPRQQVRCGRQVLVFEALPPAPSGLPRIWGSPDHGIRGRLLQLLEGGRRGDAFTLREGDNLIGRETGDITFPSDGFISGRHAMVRVQDGRAVVRDLGSSNGTFVRLNAPLSLVDGDQLLVGRQLLKVEVRPAA